MRSDDWQAEEFERQRAHLRAVAVRVLGSPADADDAVQEAWLRFQRTDTGAVDNLRGWLTTVVSRVCLDMLRARRARREQLGDEWLPETVVPFEHDGDPEREVLLADSVGLALLVVLDALTPVERLAFVLHDVFGLPFSEIAPIVDRDEAAARQLASRARRRVRAAGEPRSSHFEGQRRVVEAFLAASRNGDLEALVSVLDPEVVFRGHGGTDGPRVPEQVRGAPQVAKLVLTRGAPFAHLGRPVLVDGRPGILAAAPGQTYALVAFTIAGERVTEMELLVDPARLAQLRL